MVPFTALLVKVVGICGQRVTSVFKVHIPVICHSGAEEWQGMSQLAVFKTGGQKLFLW